jgi:hypothetical protein
MEMEIYGHFTFLDVDVYRKRIGAGIAQSVYRLATGWIAEGSEARFFSSPLCPDRFWGPSSLLSKGYRGLFPRW